MKATMPSVRARQTQQQQQPRKHLRRLAQQLVCCGVLPPISSWIEAAPVAILIVA